MGETTPAAFGGTPEAGAALTKTRQDWITQAQAQAQGPSLGDALQLTPLPTAPPPLPQLPLDPTFAALQSQAQNDQLNEFMQQARGDTASLMARYGTRLALSATAGNSPLRAA
jgi:hypothetical protein